MKPEAGRNQDPHLAVEGPRHLKVRGTFFGCLIVVLLACLTNASAQAWPSRPVRWVLSQPAGASVDITARLLAERLSRTWGQQVVVDNRPGGQSVIGAQVAARSAPDGYNYYFSTTAPLVINPHTFRSLPYDPARSFLPVAMIGSGPFVIAVGSKTPAATLAELIALARSQPGKITLANQGPRSLGGLISQILALTAEARFLQVPYNVQGVAIQDALGGRVQVVMLSTATLAPFLKRGDLRALAVTGRGRAPGLEQVPAIGETYAGFDYDGWYALLAPAGTPARIVGKVSGDVGRALSEPDIVQRLGELGVVAAGASTPSALTEFLRVERERWGKLVREIGLEPE